MIRVYQGYRIVGKQRDVEAFEEAVTELADAYDVVLDGEFEDEDDVAIVGGCGICGADLYDILPANPCFPWHLVDEDCRSVREP